MTGSFRLYAALLPLGNNPRLSVGTSHFIGYADYRHITTSATRGPVVPYILNMSPAEQAMLGSPSSYTPLRRHKLRCAQTRIVEKRQEPTGEYLGRWGKKFCDFGSAWEGRKATSFFEAHSRSAAGPSDTGLAPSTIEGQKKLGLSGLGN